jgi:hypothetical protein
MMHPEWVVLVAQAVCKAPVVLLAVVAAEAVVVVLPVVQAVQDQARAKVAAHRVPVQDRTVAAMVAVLAEVLVAVLVAVVVAGAMALMVRDRHGII